MAVNLSPVGGAAAQFFDNSGNPLTGGKLYTYAAGTTTPVVTYTTSAGNVAHTNPIVLDSAGRVSSGGEIWLTDGVIYKFVLKTSADTLIATYDNIIGINDVNANDIPYDPPFINSVVTTVAAKLAQTVSVKDFGATGDGVTDDTAAIQAAIDGLGINGGTVWFPAGTYLVSSAITFSTPASFAVPVLLKGEGAYATTITASHSGVVFDCRTAGYQALMMENILMRGPGKTVSGSVGIDCAFAYGYLDRVSFATFETAIDCTNSNLARMRQLNIINCTFGIYAVNAVSTANILYLDQSWLSYCDNATKITLFGTVTIRQSYYEQNKISFDITSSDNVTLSDIYSEAELNYSLYARNIYPTLINCRWVTLQPYFIYDEPSPLYGQTTSDGLRLGSSVNWGYNYNTGTNAYDVAFTDFIYAGIKYRCIGQTTTTGDAYEVIDASGYVTRPKQPLAIAKVSSPTANDKTGDGTVYTVIFDSETVDQSSSYDPTTGIFTTPVAGKYQIDATISLANIDAAHTYAQMDILVGATHYYSEVNLAAIKTSVNRASMVMSNCISTGAGVQIKITIAVLNGTKTIGIDSSSYLSIQLVA